MFDHTGVPVYKALPGSPVEVIGWRDLPHPGDLILQVESEVQFLKCSQTKALSCGQYSFKRYIKHLLNVKYFDQ